MMITFSAVEEPPHNKDDEKVETSPSFQLSLLPDELVLSCLAWLSRSDCAALSLVSKRYHSLVFSPELYKTRSLLGKTDKYLYVCLSTSPNTTPRWFIIHKSKTLEKTVMTPITSFASQPPKRSSLVALDSGIYVIGGWINGKPTPDVLLLDCETHTWRNVPCMGAPRASAAAGVVDGKIYVFGGCEDNDSGKKWGEVFDSKTQTWDTLPPMLDRRGKIKGLIFDSFVIEEKVYAMHWRNGSVYYSPGEGKWVLKNKPETLSCCVVENVVYGCDTKSGKLFWRESDESEWKKVNGLESLEIIFPNYWLAKCISKVSNFGVNIVLLWLDHDDNKRLDICCAEISFERREKEKSDEVWGKIEWSEVVSTFEHDRRVGDKVEVLYSVSVNV